MGHTSERDGSTTQRSFAIRRRVPHPLGWGRLTNKGKEESPAPPVRATLAKRVSTRANAWAYRSKRVTQAVIATLRGDQVGGKEGRLFQSRKKSEAMAANILLSLEKWQVGARCILPGDVCIQCFQRRTRQCTVISMEFRFHLLTRSSLSWSRVSVC